MLDILVEANEVILILSLIWDNQFYCQKKSGENDRIFWPGFCYVFVIIVGGFVLIPAMIIARFS